MASDIDFVNYVIGQINGVGIISYKKMFGEYLVYVNQKPIILICDNTAFVKKLDCVKELFEIEETGYPYNGAKEHYENGHLYHIKRQFQHSQARKAAINFEKIIR